MSNGSKRYVPWTMMDDGKWVMMEPEGELPFWKPHGPDWTQSTAGHGSVGRRIMLHEGAKAAAAAQRIAMGLWEPSSAGGLRAHPWADELAGYEHWGMIGGALAPHRTDYGELMSISPLEVVYVCDNDFPGEAALQRVSKAWGRSLKGVAFGKSFPGSWDMADPPPASLVVGGRWVGPRLEDLKKPATWATELVPPAGGGKGRPAARIKTEFAEEWLHCVTPEVFIHKDWPNRVLSAAEFNSRTAPFSHVGGTSELLKKVEASKAAVLAYTPGQEPGVYGGSALGHYINTYCPSAIAAEAGDVGPWLDFMEGLIPGERDRYEVMRWVATLVARPDIRMLYGLLLISEMQGVGKGTLGERILTPLVGEVNVSFPSEQEIVDSNFNYWLAHKRLAVVHEIYSGHSSKAYNKLKSVITDKYMTVQKKYQPNYEIENWIHIIACSNSMRAMKLSMDDRRWLIPRLSEKKRSDGYWEKLNRWLAYEGGLGIIRRWAEEFVAAEGPVQRGEAAPWSESKRIIVEESYSPGQAFAAGLLDRLRGDVESGRLPGDSFVFDADVVAAIRQEIYGGQYNDRLEKPITIRALAKGSGWCVGDAQNMVSKWPPKARVLSLDAATAATSPSELAATGRVPVMVEKKVTM
jgi:hypothetical protein